MDETNVRGYKIQTIKMTGWLNKHYRHYKRFRWLYFVYLRFFGTVRIRISDPLIDKNTRILVQSGFTDPDPDHPKETHPKTKTTRSRSHAFRRAWCRVFAWSSDWLIVLLVCICCDWSEQLLNQF